MRLGIVGPHWLRQPLSEVLLLFPSIDPSFQLSDHILDAPRFAKSLETKVDALLFSSKSAYRVARENNDYQIPCYYLPLKGAGLYAALFELTRERERHRLVIDTLPAPYIKKVLSQLNLPLELILYEGASDVPNVPKMCDFHQNQQGKSTIHITGLKMVYEQLKQQNYPVAWLRPTEEDMINAIERLLLSMPERHNKEKQITIGKVEIEFTDPEGTSFSARALQRYELEKSITHFLEEMNAYLVRLSDERFFFVAHRGDFERVTEGYKVLPFLYDKTSATSVVVRLGVGFGYSVEAAGMHADLAVLQAKQEFHSCGYVVRENRQVIGPLEINAPLVYGLESPGKMTPSKRDYQLLKVKKYLRESSISLMTATDVARLLHITERSANRILNQWLDNNLIQLEGVEKASLKGRPRQYYRFVEKGEKE